MMTTMATQGSHDQGAELPMSTTEKTVDLSELVWFYAKEHLPGKSFMHTLNYSLVRIAIGRDGIYKLDSGVPRLLAHWRFRDIKDSSYSGFSFTLQFRGGKSDYHVRTDDGENICTYIEAFQKNPDKALVQAQKNPPSSNVPESGLMTLRRKFSADNKARVPKESGGVKFHTLNRRPKKAEPDPCSSLPYNVDMDSRLRGRSMDSAHQKPLPSKDDTRHSMTLDMRPSKPPGLQEGDEGLRHSSADVRCSPTKMNGTATTVVSERLARDMMIGQHIRGTENAEKRLSNGVIPHAPISTRGEATNDASTTSSSAEKRSPSIPTDRVAMFHKAGSAPPTFLVEGVPVEGEESKAQGSRSTAGRSGSGSKGNVSAHSPLEQSKKGLSDDQSHSNSDQSHSNSDQSHSRLSGQLYDHLDDLLTHPKERTTPTSDLPNNNDSSDEMLFFGDKRRSGSLSRSSSSSAGSGVYDHLPTIASPEPPSPELPFESAVPEKRDLTKTDFSILSALGNFTSPRRNISQPALSTPNSARESPCDQFGRFPSIDEESSDEDEGRRSATPTNEGDTPETPTNTMFPPVKLRYKKKEEIASDPFADLLSPKSASRLRWSQELNPLYDYIKGFKVTDGVKMYDSTPSKLVQSSKATTGSGGGGGGDNGEGAGGGGANGKTPSMIMEEEGEEDELGSVCWEGDLSEFSQDTMSVTSQDTQQSPTSPTSSYGGDAYGDTLSLQMRSRRPQHNYEDIMAFKMPNVAMSASVPSSPAPMVTMDSILRHDSAGTPTPSERQNTTKHHHLKGSTVHGLLVSRYEDRRDGKQGISPRLGKRQLIQQRRSRTLAIRDDSETVKVKQRPIRVADALKDFSFVMREYRLFYVKMPNGFLLSEIFSINKPLIELRDKLCDYLGVDDTENYNLYVEGACLSTLRETETGVDVVRVNRTGLNYHVDSHLLPDQGADSILLKSNLSFRMQGITTTRILAFRPREMDEELLLSYSSEPPFEEEEFHKCWISIVQGNLPCTQEYAVKLAALHYQAYFLDRTAVNSVVGFSRPTEFLPVEYTSIRGVEAKMYKEQEGLSKKSHLQIEEAYINRCAELKTYGAVFFPAREPRKKLLHSTKLKPVILGVSPKGILRVDPKTKEQLGFWSYSVLKNWAYSKRTFVLAFTNKSFPVECNQAKWVSLLVDFYVDSIIQTKSSVGPTTETTAPEAGKPEK